MCRRGREGEGTEHISSKQSRQDSQLRETRTFLHIRSNDDDDGDKEEQSSLLSLHGVQRNLLQ